MKGSATMILAGLKSAGGPAFPRPLSQFRGLLKETRKHQAQNKISIIIHRRILHRSMT